MTYSYAVARRAPLLGRDEERFLIGRWQEDRDRAALEQLLLSHVRMVHFWARRLSTDKAEREDMISEGIIGMIRAADLFDPDRDVRFSTYARCWIRNGVSAALRGARSIVDVPVTIAGTELDPSGYALDGGIASEDPTPEELTIKRCEGARLNTRVARAMAALDEIDREVLTCRNLQQPPEPISELASRLGLNVGKLRQVERRALHRLRQTLLSQRVDVPVV